MRRSSLLPAALLLAAAAPAFASDQPGTFPYQWREEKTSTDLRPDGITTSNGITDAGQFIANANMTRGGGGLSQINGVLSGGPLANGSIFFDADVYCIRITNPANFSVVHNGTTDTTMSLFRADGRGIAFNDNRTDSTTSQASRLTSLLTGSLVAGDTYYLAISLNAGNSLGRRMTRPLNAAGGLLFPGPVQLAPDDATLGGSNDQRRAEVGPISPTGVFTGWELQPSTTGLPFTFTYTLTLTGVDYHQAPAPGAAGLLGLGGLVFARRRRR